ncbi:hypothetical protein ACFRAO_16815 [Streptomyces sp. NPDC056656]|uniref:hypothetical protein n=1 Tax=Streptomyces sp. NPDC056656 TaxID=3345895 RepID=UPI003688AF52
MIGCLPGRRSTTSVTSTRGWCFNCRESAKTVQKRLGHSKPGVTLDTCTHLRPDGVDTAWAAVEVALGEGP